MSRKRTPKHLELTAFKQQSNSPPKLLRDGWFEDEELAMSRKYDTSIMNSLKQQHYSCARTFATSRR